MRIGLVGISKMLEFLHFEEKTVQREPKLTWVRWDRHYIRPNQLHLLDEITRIAWESHWGNENDPDWVPF